MSIRDKLLAGRGLTGLHVIDAHAHVGPWPSFYTPQPDMRRMLLEMDRFGVEICCVSSLLAIAVDTSLGNDEVYDMLRSAPDRFLGYITLNPNQPLEENRRELEKRLAQHAGFIGIKFHPMWHGQPVDGDIYRPLWELAAGRVPLVLGHSWLGSEEPQGYGAPDRYSRMAEQFPGVTIIMGHGGGTYEGCLQAGAACVRWPNLYMDICGGEFSSLWIEDLVKTVPPEKLLFASDMPFLGLGSPVGRVGYSCIADNLKKKIFSGNMHAILARNPFKKKESHEKIGR